ncbi:BrnA antitoxin family protein [Lonepinella sp. BR2474]|uniref:BrnA antitoxin family protein n=1 Tax=unclassified Lonepinella TaxID=2642006 RepID=UPI003F6DB080
MSEKLENMNSILDEAPELDDAYFEQADLYQGDKLIRRGRPKSAQTKVAISIRLDKEVVDYLKNSGAGWQTRVNHILRSSLL